MPSLIFFTRLDLETVEHIALAAENNHRPVDLSDIKIKGTVNIKAFTRP